MRADLITVGYNLSTSLAHSSTIPATLGYRSPDPREPLLHELSSDSDVWDLMRWPARKPTLNELYWLAGLFEGEGSFDEDSVRITQKDREILDMVRRLVGGRVGGPYASVDRETGKRFEKFLWYATGPRGRGVARTLYQLLSTRRQAQARSFLRISRRQAPPQLDPADPTRMLWDWATEDELKALE